MTNPRKARSSARGLLSVEPDIESRIAKDFSLPDREDAMALLDVLYRELRGDNARIVRCVIFLADGNKDKLVHFADRALLDFRDVILWAEYDEQNRQVRDFYQPFARSCAG